MSLNLVDSQIAKPQVDAQFPVVGNCAIMKLDGDLVFYRFRLGWNIKYEYTTLSTDTKARVENKIPACQIVADSFLNVRSGHDFR